MNYYDGPPQRLEEDPQVTLYRIEDEDGVGPYMGRMLYVYRAALWAEMRDNPNAYPDTYGPKAKIKDDRVELAHLLGSRFIFGCRSLEDLRIQFPSQAGCKSMQDAGAVLAVYKISAFQTIGGVLEVAFRRGEAELTETRPVTDLHASTGETVPLRD